MNPKEHQKDFNRRWNITSLPNSEEAFQKFKNRILNIFEHISDLYIDELIKDKSIETFCQDLGIRLKWEMGRGPLEGQYSANIINFFQNENMI